MARRRWLVVVLAVVLVMASGAPALAEGGDGGGERWTRFERCPLVRGKLNGRNYVHSIGVEVPGGGRVFVNRHPALVLEVGTGRVFMASRDAFRKEKKGWSVSLGRLIPVEGGRVEAFEGADGLTVIHFWWSGNEGLLATDRVTLPDEAGEPAAGGPPVDAPPRPVTPRPGPGLMEPIGQGVRWRVPPGAGHLGSPRVTVVPNPRDLLVHFQPLGSSWRIEVPGQEPLVPVEVEFPLPPRAFSGPRRIAMIRTEGDRHSVLAPFRIDRRRHTVTVTTTRFSTWTGVLWNPGAPGAEVEGTISVRPGCEEEPRWVSFDVTRTSGGEHASFPVTLDGPGHYRVVPPIPQALFGTYSFCGLKAGSEHFLFGHLDPEPVRRIVTRTRYVQDLELVPVSGRLQGRVVDHNGRPVGNARVTLLQGVETRPGAVTGADGSFTIEMIPLEPPSADPSRSYSVRYRIQRGDGACDTLEGNTELGAGVTSRKTLVFEPRGELRGVVRDWGDEPVAGAHVELVDPGGGVHSTRTTENGDYMIREVPAGAVLVNVTCPGGENTSSAGTTIRCRGHGASQPLDFALNCRRPERYSLSVHLGRGDAAVVEAVIDGSFEVDISSEGQVEGSGRGVFHLTAAGGVCQGAQSVGIRARGHLDRESVTLDLEFDDGGVPLSWKCSGVPTPVPYSVASLEDEGRSLRLDVENANPLRAGLDRTVGPAGPARFFTRVSLEEY